MSLRKSIYREARKKFREREGERGRVREREIPQTFSVLLCPCASCLLFFKDFYLKRKNNKISIDKRERDRKKWVSEKEREGESVSVWRVKEEAGSLKDISYEKRRQIIRLFFLPFNPIIIYSLFSIHFSLSYIFLFHTFFFSFRMNERVIEWERERVNERVIEWERERESYDESIYRSLSFLMNFDTFDTSC